MLRGSDWLKKKLGRSNTSSSSNFSSTDSLPGLKEDAAAKYKVTGHSDEYDQNRAALLSTGKTQTKPKAVNPFAAEDDEEEDDHKDRLTSTNPFAATKTYNDLVAQEEDDAIHSLKVQTKQTNQAALESTRRSKQRLLQTEEAAYDTLVNLDQQGGTLSLSLFFLSVLFQSNTS